MAEVNLDLWHLIENLKTQDYVFEPHGNNRFTITSPDGQTKTDFNGNGRPEKAVQKLVETMHAAFGWSDTTIRDGDDLETRFKKHEAARNLERLADPEWDPRCIEIAERQADEQLANNRITFTFEKVTPWIAFQLLAAHENARIARGLSEDAELDLRTVLQGEPFVRQRKVSKTHKRNLGQIIRLGHFLLTHQGIAIAEDGYLLDGQHRVKTVLDEGLSAAITIARHVPDEIFPVIDAGMKRTPEQIAGMMGMANGGDITTAVRILYWYDNEPDHKKWFSRPLSSKEIIELIKDHYNTVDESHRLVKRAFKGGSLGVHMGVATALTHIVLRADPRAPIEAFWHTAATDGAPDAYWYDIFGATYINECPIFAFRHWVRNWSKRPGKGNNRGQRHTEHLICGLRTYNEAIQGNRHKKVVFKETYAVPRPVLAGRGIA